VFCCAGPFSAYRRATLEDEIWEAYMDRKFLGARCTFGDDVQLTNLVLEKGCKSVYQPRALALTIAPTTLPGYFRQQWRWNRSFYRQFRWIHLVLRENLHWYLVLDLAARAVPHLLVAAAVVLTLLHAVQLEAEGLATDLTTVAAMALVGLSTAVWQTRKLRFAVRYGLLYLGLLVPTRIWVLSTLLDNRWGTRTLGSSGSEGRTRRWRRYRRSETSSRRTRFARSWLPFVS
jgi:cellulose synthase/poly-beta-1,6-N-acetylglucosamine synthase-like glycosyltransferase